MYRLDSQVEIIGSFLLRYIFDMIWIVQLIYAPLQGTFMSVSSSNSVQFVKGGLW